MGNLENILERFGASSEFWQASPTDEESNAALVSGIKNVMSRFNLLHEVDWSKWAARFIELDLPPSMALGDLCVEEDRFDAALELYKLEIAQTRDPSTLCELGYRLLQRCRVEQLPFSENDFESFSLSRDGEETLHIDLIRFDIDLTRFDTDDPGPAFSEAERLLPLAARSFGLAYLVWSDFDRDDYTSADFWLQAFALDGLRVAFQELRDREALEVLLGPDYGGWLEAAAEFADWEELVAAADRNYSVALGFLGGLRAAKTEEPSESHLRVGERWIIFQMKELLSRVNELKLLPIDEESLATAIAEKVAGILAQAPEYLVEQRERELEKEFEGRWVQLPPAVRQLIAQAEYLRSAVYRALDFDWGLVAVPYVKAVEQLLRGLGPRLDTALRPQYPYSTSDISTFRKLFLSPQFAGVHGLKDRDTMVALGRELDDLIREYRTPAIHRPDPVALAKVMALRKLLFGSGPEEGLIWRINNLVRGG